MGDMVKTTTTARRTSGITTSAGQAVWFHRHVDEDDPATRIVAVCIDHDRWRELGEPNIITVTIEGGDTLNQPRENP